MTEPRDEIGGWLDAPVEPLGPPPGTYERIRRSARRRKRNQAIAAVATAALVVAGVVAAPRLAITLFPSGHGATAASAGGQAGSPSPAPGLRNRLPPGPAMADHGQPLPRVPDGFEPISATFVGLKTGWALGRLSTPCAAAGCLALARTDDTGASWYRVPAPATGVAAASTGVSQVRFLNRYDGWIFGPELWWTGDGGQDWQQVGTGGRRVVSLETVGSRAFAVFARCPGSQPSILNGGAGGCLSYQLYSAAAGSATWHRVLGRSTGYLLGVKGSAVTLSSGPVRGDGAWTAVTAPCASATSAARGALLATAAPNGLFAACQMGSATNAMSAEKIVNSADGGRSWQAGGIAPISGTAHSVAAAPGGSMLVIGTSTGLYVSGDSGATWQLALTGPPGGFGFVGMTDVLQGFAIPADPGQDGILFTRDGGASWQRSIVSRPA
jgi:hypothetical protein